MMHLIIVWVLAFLAGYVVIMGFETAVIEWVALGISVALIDLMILFICGRRKK